MASEGTPKLKNGPGEMNSNMVVVVFGKTTFETAHACDTRMAKTSGPHTVDCAALYLHYLSLSCFHSSAGIFKSVQSAKDWWHVE